LKNQILAIEITFFLGNNCGLATFFLGNNCGLATFFLGNNCGLTTFFLGNNCGLATFFLGNDKKTEPLFEAPPSTYIQVNNKLTNNY
jgi:hypothetical protein